PGKPRTTRARTEEATDDCGAVAQPAAARGRRVGFDTLASRAAQPARVPATEPPTPPRVRARPRTGRAHEAAAHPGAGARAAPTPPSAAPRRRGTAPWPHPAWCRRSRT